MPVSLVIPALNEEESLGRVLAAVPANTVDEIIVVDGDSRDNTVGLAEAAGARIVSEPRRGYGFACAAGLAAARGDLVLFLDADGADDPALIPDLLSPLVNDRADLVLGSRLAGPMDPGAMPGHQRLGNLLCAWLIRRLYGLPLTDLSPFRAARKDLLLGLGLKEMTYGWPTEMILKAARQGWRVSEIPVGYRPRLAGRSKISGTLRGTIFAGYHILRAILGHLGG